MTVTVRLMVSSVNYDRPYSYIVNEPVIKGSVVALPFGKANHKRFGVVTDIKEDNEDGLKEIEYALPPQYALSEEMLELAEYMSDNLCTSFGECASLMLPKGLDIKCEVKYKKGENFEELKRINEALYDITDKLSEIDGKTLLPYADEIPKLLRKKVFSKYTAAKTEISEKNIRGIKLKSDFTEPDLKGVKSKEIYEKVIEYLKNTDGAVPVRTLFDIFGITNANINLLVKRNIAETEDIRVMREAYDLEKFKVNRDEIILSHEQKSAYDELLKLHESGKAEAVMLFGITGSGKTSVILSMIDRLVSEGKGVIMLVPEIALTSQSAGILFSRYGDKVALLHSAMSTGERHDTYERIKSGEKSIVLGTRSAIFAPVGNLSMIVIDEEQDSSYKSESSPHYNAIDIARFRCAKNNALMLLASATPDVESFYRAKNGRYKLIKLNKRYGNAKLPRTTVCDLLHDSKSSPSKLIGSILEDKIRETLSRGEQVILFVNRRGLKSLLVCGDCQESLLCPNCSVPMTLHKKDGAFRLSCHYCGYTMPPPMKCPSCGSNHMSYRGYGTEKLEEEIKYIFPEAKTLRMDADTTVKKFSHDEIIKDFADGKADILIGTQMVTKGHNFPNVTLVGVVMADLSLATSDYRAGERTFSIITQVMGRAGRGDKVGEAVIQTLNPSNDVIMLSSTQNYEAFYEGEIEMRKSLLFPPFCTLGAFVMSSRYESALTETCAEVRKTLDRLINGEYSDVKLLYNGPFEDIPYKVKNTFRKKITVKYKNTKRARELFGKILKTDLKNGVYIDFDQNPDSI